MPSINLHEAYSKQIADRFTADSYVKGNTSNDYSFDGLKSLNITTFKTIPVTNYTRSGLLRFGTPTEVEDFIQTLTMTQDKAWTATIDKGNASDQQYIKEAGKVMKMQSEEVTGPMADKYALDVFAKKAGQIVALAAAPTKSTVVEKIFEAGAALDNALVPTANRVLYVGSTTYNLIRLSPEFIGVDKLGEKALSKGVVGTIADMKCVKVPDSYMPSNVYFMITHKKSVIMPSKLKTARILSEVQGVDGRVLEWHNYYDAFVIGARANGVYVAAKANTVATTPTISISSGSATITSSGATAIYYTLDGSDPRYSKTAQLYSSAVAVTSGTTVSAYATKTNNFDSGVASEIA